MSSNNSHNEPKSPINFRGLFRTGKKNLWAGYNTSCRTLARTMALQGDALAQDWCARKRINVNYVAPVVVAAKAPVVAVQQDEAPVVKAKRAPAKPRAKKAVQA